MSLVTRCPRCRTLFRVMPVQLQAHAGQVRCGRCMEVFDGFEALAAEQANAISGPIRFEPESEPAAMAPRGTPAVAGAPAQPAATAPATGAAPAPVSALRARLRDFFSGKTRAGEPPLFKRLLRRPSQRALWAGGAALLAFTLGVQVAYAYRKELAGRYPAVRSALESVCDLTGCTVALPQRPDLMRIEASDVHMIDANRPSLIQLTATLRSYANYDLAYPALDLVLTNTNEHALARRIFLPADYLGRSRDPEGGVPPNAEITVALDLDTGDLNAAGFRLDLLAAPAP